MSVSVPSAWSRNANSSAFDAYAMCPSPCDSSSKFSVSGCMYGPIIRLRAMRCTYRALPRSGLLEDVINRAPRVTLRLLNIFSTQQSRTDAHRWLRWSIRRPLTVIDAFHLIYILFVLYASHVSTFCVLSLVLFSPFSEDRLDRFDFNNILHIYTGKVIDIYESLWQY